MSLATKSSTPTRIQGRIWRVPISNARWYWLGASIVLYVAILAWYIFATRTQRFPAPINDPFRLFGIIAFVLVLSTAAYTLRRRFARGLPGKVQNWLWMHTWIGIITILIALLHETFIGITNNFCQNLTCLTDANWGLSARLALVQSLQRQQRARQIMRVWRSVHMVLASLALLIILYHGVMELLSNVFHVIPAA